MTLAAAPGAQVLIDRPGPNNKHESNLEFENWEGDGTVAFWLVEGLEVANAPFWGIDVRGNEATHSHNFIIQNNRVHDNGLDSEKTGIFFAFVDDVLVKGNESYANGEHGVYLSNSGDRFVVSGNRLHGNNNCGLHINGDLESGEDGIISNGLIENNTIYENGEGGCAGINMDGVTDTIVLNNLLYENLGSGIAIFQENGAVCSQNVQVLNNTIVQAEEGRWAIIISGDDCINNKIFNNIILTAHEWRGSILIPTAGISGFESDYNVIMDRFSADDDESVITLSEWQSLGYDANSIIAASSEVFAGPNDYHLGQDSAALDAGRNLPGVGLDLEGAARPQGSAFDIGAFELGDGSAAQAESSESAAPADAAGGTITYSLDGRVFRVAAQEGATAEDISLALDGLSPGGGDQSLNISPDGQWLVLETERFDPECVDWSCLAVVSADLSAGEALRTSEGLVRANDGISAVASGGNLVVYSYTGGPHQMDLWAVSRTGEAWSAPILLSADSADEYNFQPALSEDGSKVLFMCGPIQYGGEGTSICEVGTDGTGFRVVLTPADGPAGFPTTGALHQPDYAPDGSIVFEADWEGEQIWRLALGASEPVRVTDAFGNDNSPCVLPDGRIVSLWLNRPEGTALHEIKIMSSDGASFIMVVPDIDVVDAGQGCGA
jgi:parallel beta-helix repeat protein